MQRQTKPFYCISEPAFLRIPELMDGKQTLHQTLLVPYVLEFIEGCITTKRNNLIDIENECHREVERNENFDKHLLDVLVVSLVEEVVSTLKRDLAMMNIHPENIDVYLTDVWQDKNHFRFQGYLHG